MLKVIIITLGWVASASAGSFRLSAAMQKQGDLYSLFTGATGVLAETSAATGQLKDIANYGTNSAFGERKVNYSDIQAASSGRIPLDLPNSNSELSNITSLNPDIPVEISDGLFAIDFHSYAPILQYLIISSPTAIFECDPILAVSRGLTISSGTVGFSCRDDNQTTIASFEPMIVDYGTNVITINYFVEDAVSSSVTKKLLLIALHRLNNWSLMEKATASITDSNDTRVTEARLTTAFLFFFIGTGMLLWSFAAGLLLGWVIQPLPVPEKLSKLNKVQFNTLVFSIVTAVLNYTISAAAGFSGWFIMGALYFFIIIGIAIAQLIKRIRIKKRESSSVAPQPDGQDNVIVSEEGDDDKEQDSDADKKDLSRNPDSNLDGPPKPNWRTAERGTLGKTQLRLLLGYSVSMFLLVIIILLIVFAWQVEEYRIYDRHQGNEIVEAIPSLTAKAVQFMYAWQGLATNMKLHLYTKWLTEWCGSKYKKTLSNSGKDAMIRDSFITEYAIDMTEYQPADYRMYASVNEWFIRGLAPNARPIAGDRIKHSSVSLSIKAQHESNALSPADCRMLIFPTISDSKVWIKGSSFNYAELLDKRGSWSALFHEGSMVIARLAPQDYHRFNSPVSGQIVDKYKVSGTYWSVNADAAKSHNYAFYNLRNIVIIRYGQPSNYKHVAYVAIGATCVGSVVYTRNFNDTVSAGDELGFMQFGGSTVIILFEKVCFFFYYNYMIK